MKPRLLVGLFIAFTSAFSSLPNLALAADITLPPTKSELQELLKKPSLPKTPPPPAARVRDENMAMGNPSAATSDPRNENNYLMRKSEYVLSYNNGTHLPNWVSWHLNASWIGDTERKNNFKPDPDLPNGWFQVLPRDYTRTGFDRGHMCNFMDRSRDAQSASNTFFMTNMIPQSPKNNEETWEQLESYSRTLAREGHELYIVSGPAGQGGEGKNGTMDKIVAKRGDREIAIVVPAFTWKVMLVLPKGKTSPKDVTSDATTIAVIMPNTQQIDFDWKRYLVPVVTVEGLTHLSFFTEVDPKIAAEIKKRIYQP